MKATTLQQRLNKYCATPSSWGAEPSKSSQHVRIAFDLANGTNKTYRLPYGFTAAQGDAKGVVIRACYTSGSGRYTSNQDHTDATATLLRALGVKIEVGNDAPRGGATGKYIKILSNITY